MLIILVRYAWQQSGAILYVDRPSGEILHHEYYNVVNGQWYERVSTEPFTLQDYVNFGMSGEQYEILAVV